MSLQFVLMPSRLRRFGLGTGPCSDARRPPGLAKPSRAWQGRQLKWRVQKTETASRRPRSCFGVGKDARGPSPAAKRSSGRMAGTGASSSQIQLLDPVHALQHERCALPTWWLLRGRCTRSHSEPGREMPQRRWYFVSRRGRVGRCQVCKTQLSNLLVHDQKPPNPNTRPRKRPFAVPQTQDNRANNARRPIVDPPRNDLQKHKPGNPGHTKSTRGGAAR